MENVPNRRDCWQLMTNFHWRGQRRGSVWSLKHAFLQREGSPCLPDSALFQKTQVLLPLASVRTRYQDTTALPRPGRRPGSEPSWPDSKKTSCGCVGDLSSPEKEPTWLSLHDSPASIPKPEANQASAALWRQYSQTATFCAKPPVSAPHTGNPWRKMEPMQISSMKGEFSLFEERSPGQFDRGKEAMMFE